jgi:hypothetical protein
MLQSVNVVEHPEFRNIILYCGQGLIANKDVPHRNKITSEAHAMYLQSKSAIKLEMEVRIWIIGMCNSI